MQYVRNCVGWFLPTRASRHVPNRQALKAFVFGLLLLTLVVPGQMFGQAKTIELSSILARSTLLGPVDRHQQISVLLALPLSDTQAAAEFVRHVSTPGDPLFHQYLTPQEFADGMGSDGLSNGFPLKDKH